MKHTILIVHLLLLTACNSTKSITKNSNHLSDPNPEENTELQFGCYNSSDTLENVIAYFPEEKAFFINNRPCKKEDVCSAIKHAINLNKGVKYYYEPKSNFFDMMSIIREIESCYKEKIEELSIEEFGANYEMLSPQQKSKIDSILTYRMVS